MPEEVEMERKRTTEQVFSPVTTRAYLRESVAEACRAIGPYWPMKTYAYYNPLRDFEHLPFTEAIGKAQHLLGGKGFLSLQDYRLLFHQGRITRSTVEQALHRAGPPLPSPASIRMSGRVIHVRDVWRIHAIFGIEALNPVLLTWTLELEGAVARFRADFPEGSRIAIIDRTIRDCPSCRHNPEAAYLKNLWQSVLSLFHLSDPLSGPSSLPCGPECTIREGPSTIDLPIARTLTDWLDTVTGSAMVEAINNHMIKWISAFVDEGVAAWSMPSKEKGFYSAWRELAQEDVSSKFLGISQVRQKIRELSDDPEEALSDHLSRLEIPKERWGEYLSRHLAHMPGWSGFIRWRGDNPGYPAQQHYPITPLQYLAVRLFYESELVDMLCQREWGIHGTYSALTEYWNNHQEEYPGLGDPSADVIDANTHAVCQQAWRIFHLAQFLEMTSIELQEASQEDMFIVLKWLDLFPHVAHGPVWLEAYEDVYRKQLLRKIQTCEQEPSFPDVRPRAQGIFCIDARSESFRRHLEAQGPYETFGFAGFFGVPMSYMAFDSHDRLALCPILLSPMAEVVETPRDGQEDRIRDYFSGSRWHQLSDYVFHDLKQNPIASLMYIDVIGLFFSLGLIGKTFFRTFSRTIKDRFKKWFVNPVNTRISVDRERGKEFTERSPVQMLQGFTLQEQASLVEGGLRVIGLTKNFGRFVMVCGHGSQTDNNPYFAALDCGACGGSHGDPNARVFAAMANNGEVRRILHDHGLHIPEDTWFLSAKHNTTTDRVTLYDLIEVPSAFAPELDLLIKDLEGAGAPQALERCHRIPGARTIHSPHTAFSHVKTRSVDWANSRPEWGLSGNAAFVIGRRLLTKDLHLEGRVFLHSYDPESDPDGSILEKIMTAPLIVGELINLTYYFSSVDPWSYGSGSKVIHNMVAGIGVMLGSQSDLQKGLPLQSVNDGIRHYHEPLRLLAIIEAPTDRIDSIIQRHTLLQHLFRNQWMNVMALNPDTKVFTRYLPDSSWESVSLSS